MKMITFKDKINIEKLDIKRQKIETLQVNLGKKCNQSCSHCHVASGPGRVENMDRRTVDRLLELLRADKTITTVDLTGGAPELNPNFNYLVQAVRAMGIHVVDRCNLTVLLEEGQEKTAAFLAEHGVEIVASLPCYTEQNVDAQRGRGTFVKSIEALKMLNSIGYGGADEKLILNLVYNPGGAFLPGQQLQLENDYKARLLEDHGILFNRLYTITNLPVNRFGQQLRKEGKLDEYMKLLSDNFNVCAAANVMCRSLVSIGWNGLIYDCDFNQMLDKPIADDKNSIFAIRALSDITENIVMHDACFGCTAGSGSSCGGALV